MRVVASSWLMKRVLSKVVESKPMDLGCLAGNSLHSAHYGKKGSECSLDFLMLW